MDAFVQAISPYMDLGLGGLAILLYHRLDKALAVFQAGQKTLVDTLINRLESHDQRLTALESR